MLDFGHVLAGVAVVMALEGLCYAAFPGAMKAMLARLSELPQHRLRQGGLVAAAIGVAFAWLIVTL